MNNKYLLTFLAFILIGFSVKADEIIEDKPSLKGKHLIAVSLVNFNYFLTPFLDADRPKSEFANYFNSVTYSYGIGNKTYFRNSLTFFQNNYEGSTRRERDFFIKFRSLEYRTGIEKQIGKRNLKGIYGIDVRAQYARTNSNYYCIECYPNYLKLDYVPYKVRQLDLGLVPFVGLRYLTPSGFFVSTEISASFNRQFVSEHHTGKTVDYDIIPFTTRLLNMGYAF